MDELEIRERILLECETLFMKFGVRSVSMDDIARHLSISKKTLYQHFADKDELVTLMAQRHMKQDKEGFDVITNQSKNAIDELVKISALMKRDLEDMNPCLLFDLQKFHTKAWNVWVDYRDNYMRQSVVRNIKQGIEEGYYRPEINPEILATVRIEVLEVGLDLKKFLNGKFNLTEVKVQVFEHFIYGLLTEKGKKLYEKYKQLY